MVKIKNYYSLIVDNMPIRHTSKGWYWGSKGPFKSRAKAVQVAQAAHSNDYKPKKKKK